MKKIRFFITMILVLSVFAGMTTLAHADELPENMLEKKYAATMGMVKDVPVDTHQLITPTWISDNKCTFIGPDGIRAYAYLPRPAEVATQGRELIEEYHMTLPENGDYYERLYSTQSLTAYKLFEYITKVWAPASSYNITSSKTISWKHEGGLSLTIKKKVVAHYSLNYTITTTESVGTTIPADSNRYSKLALFARYKHNNIALQSYGVRDGVVIMNDWEYSSTDNPYDYRYQLVYQ